MAEAPISLYFDLEPGQTADLEVVSRAALAWAATIKELAFVLDPSMEVRVEVANATQGSFSLNAILKSLHAKLGAATHDPATLKAILIGLAIHFGWETVDHLYEKFVLDRGEETVTLSDEQLTKLAEQIERARGARVAEQHARQVFREAERDPAIKGVGVTITPGERPAIIVPRAEFARRAGHGQIREETVRRRIVPDRQRVVLIKPVLVPGNRRWSLRTAQGEYGFTIRDTVFVERVLSGTTPIPMVAGIEMDVDVETTEEFREGVWVQTERTVTHVLGLRQPERQASLMLPPREDDEPDNDDH